MTRAAARTAKRLCRAFGYKVHIRSRSPIPFASLVAAVAATLAASAAFAAPAVADFTAGAATIDTTPRLAAGDPNGFAARCPAGLYSGPRVWADDEPYIDVNGNGHYDSGEPYCDFNGNGRHDQIYTSGAGIGSPVPATSVHDPLGARAIAVGDGSQTAVVVSVVAQGLFDNYTDQMATMARQRNPSISEVVVSANHNESSPDTIGIYGGPAPQPGQPLPGPPAGAQSGIDDYYMTYLVGQVGRVAAQAAASAQAATLRAEQFPLPANLAVRLSDNWPTTDNSDTRPTAVDPKVGVLQALDAGGHPIFTVMSLAAHNQEIGHADGGDNPALSSDWPGYFEQALESRVGGQAMFLVADNGSEEDPGTVPPTGGGEGTYAQAQATGEAFAGAVAAQAPFAQALRTGTIRYARTDFCVPVENTLFKAAAGAGLFGQRPTYLYQGGACAATGVSPGTGPTLEGAPDGLRTTASILDLGPDLQLVDNPGESFPALMLGGPWGLEDVPAECRGRANPAVPLWRSHALFRFNVGLANDMIGYEIPPWAFIGSYGTFVSQYGDPQCQTGSPSDPTGSTDSAGHHHKLETEGIGPTGSTLVAAHLADLIGGDSPDASARVGPGRFVLADGHYSRNPAGAVGILVPDAGKGALDPAGGTLLGAPGVAGMGQRAVDGEAVFMDFDGQPQAAPDLTTRGMVTFDATGCVASRYYLDVFPALDTTRPLGAVARQPAVPPSGACPGAGAGGVTGVQRLAGQRAGILSASARGTAGPGALRGCTAAHRPISRIGRRRLAARRGHLRVAGNGASRGCRRGLARVTVEIAHVVGHSCRFVVPGGTLSAVRDCRRPILLLARGRSRWSLAIQLHVPRGTYHLVSRAVDVAGRVERQRRRGSNAASLRVT